jgi:hypothetical protein
MEKIVGISKASPAARNHGLGDVVAQICEPLRFSGPSDRSSSVDSPQALLAGCPERKNDRAPIRGPGWPAIAPISPRELLCFSRWIEAARESQQVEFADRDVGIATEYESAPIWR